jgi:zinc transporter ZupT
LLLVPVLSTLAGGALALRARRYLWLLIALGAGLLLGTASLDLMPEALELSRTVGERAAFVWAVAGGGFAFFWVLDGLLSRWAKGRKEPGIRKALGRVSGSLLILHSFRDGMVIGAAYSASRSAGLVVALGIVAHDVGDGINTVILSTAGERAQTWDYAFLLADALAPLLGGLLTIWWVQSPANAVVLLALAAGFFVQMATNDALPKLREFWRYRWRMLLVFAGGVGLIYLANLSLARFGG